MMNNDLIDRNPLTRLPGNNAILSKLNRVILDKNNFVVYIDLIDFKPYNEVYGFTAGDNVILNLSRIIINTCCDLPDDEYFIGHIGGDDFVVLIPEYFIDEFKKRINNKFLNERPSFYNPNDLSRGFIIGWDREGNRKRFSLMGLVAAIFSPGKLDLGSADEVSQFATHLKESAKTRKEKDNVFIGPDNLDIIPVPIKDFIFNEKVPLYIRRTLIEAMGESGLIYYGRMLTGILEEPLNIFLKKSIIYSLGRLRYFSAEEKILKFIEHDNPHLRTRAVEALGSIGGTKYVKKIGKLISDRNPYVAIMASKSLGNIGHPDGLTYLRSIPSGSSRWLNIECMITRCSLKDETVFPDIKSYLKDPNPIFRKRISKALEHLPMKKSALIIYESILDEQSASVKEVLIRSFASIIIKIGFDDLNSIRKEIIKIYKIASEDLRCFLFPAIAKLGLKKTKKILEKYIKSDSNIKRLMSIEGMVNYRSPEHVYLVRRSLKDPSPSIRARSSRAISEFHDIEGLEYLRKTLKDDDDYVRKITSESIIQMIKNICQKNYEY